MSSSSSQPRPAAATHGRAMSSLDPLAPEWCPRRPGWPPCCRSCHDSCCLWAPARVPSSWITPLAAAQKRLLLACLLHCRLGAAGPLMSALRERVLVEDIALHLRGRPPLRFTHAPPTLAVAAGSCSSTARKKPADRWGHYRTAVAFCQPARGEPPSGCHWDGIGSISNGMLTGRHFAIFTVVKRAGWMRCGVAPPWLAAAFHEGSTTASAQSGCWAFNTALGQLAHGREHSKWEGQEPADAGDEIGLLLDLGAGGPAEGKMVVFKNGARLGVMVPRGAGLGGPLCWMVELHEVGDVVRVAEHPPPRDDDDDDDDAALAGD
jgi:hypothetical protein